MSPALQNFLAQTKEKCDKTAVKMAKLELTVFDNQDHQDQLKQYFGFTDKSLVKRKKDLQKAASE